MSPPHNFRYSAILETLAAAILWSPITMKIDAFLDWSSLILPAPAVGSSIQLSEYVYDKPQEKLAEISDSTDTQYYDVRSYNAVVTGQQVRVTGRHGTYRLLATILRAGYRWDPDLQQLDQGIPEE